MKSARYFSKKRGKHPFRYCQLSGPSSARPKRRFNVKTESMLGSRLKWFEIEMGSMGDDLQGMDIKETGMFGKVESNIFEVFECYIRKPQIQFLADDIKYGKIIQEYSFVPLEPDLGC